MAAITKTTELVITREDSTRIIIVTPIGIMGPPGPCGGTVLEVSGGLLGICGSTGINVVIDEQLNTGYISLNITDPGIADSYIPISHTSFTSLSSDTGTARKIAFLGSDGGITFDYIRNYDIFKPSEFTLQITSFNIANLGNTRLIGTGVLSLNTMVASIVYTKTVNSASMQVTSDASHAGFPQTLSAPYNSYTFDSSDVLGYPVSPGTSKVITLTAIGDTNTATATYSVNFLNNIYHGVVASPSTNIAQIISAGTTILNSTSNTRSRTFIANASNVNDYIYYSYPSRLGFATFVVGGFEGGFQLLTTESHTNSLGYIENYYVYRSEQKGLGNTTITVS